MSIKQFSNKNVFFFSFIAVLFNLNFASAGEDFEIPIDDQCPWGWVCGKEPIINDPTPRPTPPPPISTPLPGETKLECIARINNDISVCVGLTDSYLNSRGCRILGRILPSWGPSCFADLYASQVPVKSIGFCSGLGTSKKAQQCQ